MAHWSGKGHCRIIFAGFKPSQIPVRSQFIFIQEIIHSFQSDAVELSKFPKQQSLRELGHGYYHLVFEYLKALWAAHATLVLDVELEKAGEHSLSGDVQSYSHGWVHGRRHGAATQHRGQSAQYAYIDHRIPVQIQHIFRVEERFTDTQTLTANLAIVRRFQEDPVIFNFPWALWYANPYTSNCTPQLIFRATDIGVQVWQANIFGRSEVIALEQLSGHFVLAQIPVRRRELWITIAFDHVCRIFASAWDQSEPYCAGCHRIRRNNRVRRIIVT